MGLEEVISAMRAVGKIPRPLVRKWMQSNDVEVLGAVYSLFMEPRYYRRIQPSLTIDDYRKFVLPFLQRCILDNPQGDWSLTRYEAAWCAEDWFTQLWNDKHVPRRELSRMKAWLVKMYMDNGGEVRQCIVTAVLEHLFERTDIRRFFSDWQKDPVLRGAFSASTAWSDLGSTGSL